MRSFLSALILLTLLLTSCTRSAPVNTHFTPVAPIANPNQPTGLPVMTYLPPTRAPGVPIASPTANGALLPTFTPLPGEVAQQFLPTPGPLSYTVQQGDYPASIASQFGITTEELLSTNNLSADTIIYPGDTLIIPVFTRQQAPIIAAVPQLASADYFKIIPDSELIYGPLSSLLDVEAFIQKQSGYLAYYTQDVNGETLTGAQIVVRVAQNYSVNPRLLLAMLEYRAQWVTNPNPAPSTTYTPIGYVDDFHQGLYRQLTWAADMLNQGFYRWKESKIQSWILADGTEIIPQPGINPGTAGIQNLFAKLDDQSSWLIDTGPKGLYATYIMMYGYPFDWAIEPLLPAGLTQPTLTLPFRAGEIWQYTGGPHAGWDEGTAWAALDFAPPGDPIGCGPSEAWTTAVAPGLIIRADHGAVVEDLDGDGLEQTGWTILYMHMESRGRVQPGAHVKVGDNIGHPSCEGGLANADHLHLARRYNGLWIPAADPNIPFVLDSFVSTGSEVEYDGWLTRNGVSVEAWDGSSAINAIQR